MRIWHRLKTVLPLLLALTTSASVLAQEFFSFPGGGAPAFLTASGQSTTGDAGMSPSFLSHPFISPFDHAVERHFSSDGLWFRDTVGHFGRDARRFTYHLDIEWMRTKTRNLKGILGDTDALYPIQDDLTEEIPGGAEALISNTQFPVNVNGLPSVLSHGMRMQWSMQNRDGWGIVLSGQWNTDSTAIFDARQIVESYRIPRVDALVLAATGGIGNPALLNNLRGITPTDKEITQNLILGERVFDEEDMEMFGAFGTTFDVLNRTLVSLPSLPLQNGDNVDGIAQQFDIDFIIRHGVETFGAGAHFESGTVFEHSGIRFRCLVGGRYFRIDEAWQFRGTDSGLGYTRPESFDRIDNDDDYLVDEVDEHGGEPTFTQRNLSDQILIRSRIDNYVRSDLGGPEIGLSYDLSDVFGLNLTGTTRVGVLINSERLQLSGDNIGGDVFESEELMIEILQNMFDTTTTNGPSQNAFQDQDGGQHASPMFEQSLTAQLPMFRRFPVLRDIPILEHATLQLGWTFLWIGEVADPNKSIVWESNPLAGLFPSLRVRRNNFYQNSFRMGVSCEY